MRSSGIFLSISSLFSDFGIGGFGSEVETFAEFIKNGGGHWWQVLPITTIGLGNSPYSGVSAFAGNYLYIDPVKLCKKGYINEADVEEAKYHGEPYTVDYDFVLNSKRRVIEKAYENIKKDKSSLLELYMGSNRNWLLDYALYMSIKDYFGGKPWFEWDEPYKMHDNSVIGQFISEHSEEIGYYVCEQYLFEEQWQECRATIAKYNIKIIGDMPIYVSYDSADVWANPENFELESQTLKPKKIAGVPPDYFCREGQLWGNPIYNYDYMKKHRFNWFVERIERMFKLYDKLRIDHFRAFDRYWAVDFGAENAINGEWVQGCGDDLFPILHKKFPNADIIAEDLGIIDDGVIAMREKYGFPGMRVLQFALDSGSSPHIPHNFERNSVVYTGTHDNNTTYGWLTHLNHEQMSKLQDYLGEYDELRGGENNNYIWSCIRVLMTSVADIVIIPFQDLAGWGEDTRLNIPGVAENNWRVRVPRYVLNNIQLDKLLRYNFITDRIVG